MSAAADRFDVRSPDGTPLAVWVEGDGPPLVLVHGAMSDHARFVALAEELRSTMTLYSMDRRGRGASGDGAAYDIELEFDDVAAVVDAVSGRAGGPVALWGHSYGADVAMGAAPRTAAVSHLLLYEPGLGMTYPPGSVEAVERALAAGDLEAAAVALLVDVVEVTEAELEAARSTAQWPDRVATMPTVPRELVAESGWRYEPGQFDAVSALTLLLAGSESPPAQQDATRAAAAAIPGARVHVLEGHGHMAHATDPAMVATVIRDFVAGA